MVDSSSLPGLAPSASFLPPCRWSLLQFCLVSVYTMGLPAVCTFPYLVYTLSGLYLVAYYALLLLVAAPVAFLQLKLGAVFRRGAVGIVSHFMPALKGVPVAMLSMAYVSGLASTVHVGHAVYYMLAGVSRPYPWEARANSTTYRVDMSRASHVFLMSSPAENYYYNTFLQKSASLSSPGPVPWHLGLCLVAAWLFVYLMVCRGPQWYGKVVYVTAPLAVLLLLTLLIYTHTAVPAAAASLTHFFSPASPGGLVNHINGEHPGAGGGGGGGGLLDSELSSPLTWIRALMQHVLCVGLWHGILPSLGNHVGNRKPISNLLWLLLLLVHSILPHLGTIAVAPLVHGLATAKGRPIAHVIREGPALLFITLPEALAVLRVHPFWTVCLYLMVILFSLHLQALLLLVILENLVECYPQHTQTVFRHRSLLAGAGCALSLLLSLPCVTEGGAYLLALLDGAALRLLAAAVMLAVPPLAIAYARLDPFYLPPERLGLSLWFAVASLSSAALMVYDYCVYGRTESSDSHNVLSWLVALCPLLISTVAGFLHALWQANNRGWQKLPEIFKANPNNPNSLSRHYADGEINGSVAQNGTGTGRFNPTNERFKGFQNGRHLPAKAELEVCIPSYDESSPTNL